MRTDLKYGCEKLTNPNSHVVHLTRKALIAHIGMFFIGTEEAQFSRSRKSLYKVILWFITRHFPPALTQNKLYLFAPSSPTTIIFTAIWAKKYCLLNLANKLQESGRNVHTLVSRKMWGTRRFVRSRGERLRRTWRHADNLREFLNDNYPFSDNAAFLVVAVRINRCNSSGNDNT